MTELLGQEGKIWKQSVQAIASNKFDVRKSEVYGANKEEKEGRCQGRRGY